MPAPLLLLLTVLLGAPLSARADDLIVLLDTRTCPNCKLANADLVHADLRDADLNSADLRRANLSRARLDGADLRYADLRFSSLQGASLRGADLRGAQLDGTDLRQADLSGARLNPQALQETHWFGAQGVPNASLSHAGLHNAGVMAFQAGHWSQAEQLFGEAIRSNANEPLSWVARGITRSELTKDELAAADFRHAAAIYRKQESEALATQLIIAAESIQKRRFESKTPTEGKGLGGQLLQSGMNTARFLAPIAAKALVPLGLGL